MLAFNFAEAILAKIFPAKSYVQYIKEQRVHVPKSNRDMEEWIFKNEWPGSSGFGEEIRKASNVFFTPFNLQILNDNPSPLYTTGASVKALPSRNNRDKLWIQNHSYFSVYLNSIQFRTDTTTVSVQQFIIKPEEEKKFEGWIDEVWIAVPPATIYGGPAVITLGVTDNVIFAEFLK